MRPGGVRLPGSPFVNPRHVSADAYRLASPVLPPRVFTPPTDLGSSSPVPRGCGLSCRRAYRGNRLAGVGPASAVRRRSSERRVTVPQLVPSSRRPRAACSGLPRKRKRLFYRPLPIELCPGRADPVKLCGAHHIEGVGLHGARVSVPRRWLSAVLRFTGASVRTSTPTPKRPAGVEPAALRPPPDIPRWAFSGRSVCGPGFRCAALGLSGHGVHRATGSC